MTRTASGRSSRSAISQIESSDESARGETQDFRGKGEGRQLLRCSAPPAVRLFASSRGKIARRRRGREPGKCPAPFIADDLLWVDALVAREAERDAYRMATEGGILHAPEKGIATPIRKASDLFLNPWASRAYRERRARVKESSKLICKFLVDVESNKMLLANRKAALRGQGVYFDDPIPAVPHAQRLSKVRAWARMGDLRASESIASREARRGARLRRLHCIPDWWPAKAGRVAPSDAPWRRDGRQLAAMRAACPNCRSGIRMSSVGRKNIVVMSKDLECARERGVWIDKREASNRRDGKGICIIGSGGASCMLGELGGGLSGLSGSHNCRIKTCDPFAAGRRAGEMRLAASLKSRGAKS